MRTREGTSNGFWLRELGNKRDAINQKWFNRGNSPRCMNSACGVRIPKGAKLYGLMNGIRCQRCYEFAKAAKLEWSSAEDTRPKLLGTLGVCDECHRPTLMVHPWDEEMLCDGCNTARCCGFGTDNLIPDTDFETVLACANPACCSTRARVKVNHALELGQRLDVFQTLTFSQDYL